MNWESRLDEFGRKLLHAIGTQPEWLPTDRNPVCEALKQNSHLLNDLEETYDWFNKTTCRLALSKVATICQMVVYDANGGPDGDSSPKGLRRQWYAWYKVDFAQHLSEMLDEDEFNGTLWAGRLSQTYAWFVDEAGVTYRDLWVDDSSRMMEHYWDRLFEGCHIVVAVEKDSLFADFTAGAKALGARSVLSGKGKNSKAATEKLLREHFGWTSDHNPFSEDEPLIVLHISDHDFDGEAVIGPTFGEQARRYTSHVLEARVGIWPENVERGEWLDKWYSVKTNNKGYERWAEEKGLFLAECSVCGHLWPVKGAEARGQDGWARAHICPSCQGESLNLVVRVGLEIVNQPHGFEVEALPTRSYYYLLVDALLRVLPFDYIIRRLREECTADAHSAAQAITEKICEANETYRTLLEEFDRLEAIKAEFENRARDALQSLGEPHVSDWESDDLDPEPEEYKEWVRGASSWTGPWRPFQRSNRTEKLVQFLRETQGDLIAQLESESIRF